MKAISEDLMLGDHTKHNYRFPIVYKKYKLIIQENKFKGHLNIPTLFLMDQGELCNLLN